jgi:hypothetical protein
MARKTVSLPVPPNPNIEQVLGEFLAEQKRRLKPATFSNYESVIDLLRSHLNGYAYDGLSRAESALFKKHYNAEGKEHREFCEIFGPDKIVESFSGFLGYFMVRKVLAGEELKRAAGTVTKKLSKWLVEKGYTSQELALEGSEEGAAAARNLPRAERAARLLYEDTNRTALDPNSLSDEDYQDFDHYTIVKIEPGKLWMESFTGGEELIGPVRAPEKATTLLRTGWNISCSLGRIRGQWRLLEMGNVYPD